MIRTTILMLLAISSQGLAVMTAPVWDGDANATRQRWQFTSDDTQPTPEDSANAYGTPGAEVTVNSPSGSGWQDPALESEGTVQSGVNMDGAWDVGINGSVVGSVPVAPSVASLLPGESYTVEFFVYSVFYEGITATPDFSVPGHTITGLSTDSETLEPDTPGRWDHKMWTGSIEGVASDEVDFALTAPSDNTSVIDSYDVYTRYTVVPEPSGMLLALLGGAGLFLRRSRKS